MIFLSFFNFRILPFSKTTWYCHTLIKQHGLIKNNTICALSFNCLLLLWYNSPMVNRSHIKQKYSTGTTVRYIHKGVICSDTIVMFDGHDCSYFIAIEDDEGLWVDQENILEGVIDQIDELMDI